MKDRKDWPERIEVAVWKKTKSGHLAYEGPRTVKEVAADLETALERADASYEYVSTAGSTGPSEEANALWPRGNTYVVLRTGGNEGYSLYVCVEVGKVEMFRHRAGSTMPRTGGLVMEPIRVKLLTSREDALNVFDLVWHLLED